MKKLTYSYAFIGMLILLFSCNTNQEKDCCKKPKEIQTEVRPNEKQTRKPIILINRRHSKKGEICKEVESVDIKNSVYSTIDGLAIIHVLVPEGGTLKQIGNIKDNTITFKSKNGTDKNSIIDVIPVIIPNISTIRADTLNVKLEVDICPKVSDDIIKYKNSEVPGHP